MPRVLLVAALALVACGSLNVGQGLAVEQAQVLRVVETGERRVEGLPPSPFQRLELVLETGPDAGRRITVEWSGYYALNSYGLLGPGERVLVTRTDTGGEASYAIREVIRLPALLPFAGLLVLVLVLVARRKGLTSVLGLVASVGVFVLFVIPGVRRGDDPLVTALIGSAVVLVASVYLVHGLNRKSSAALLGASAGLLIVAGLAAIGLAVAHITGLATEDAVILTVANAGRVDLPKLQLAGILLGSLGALVDMTVGQSSTTFELAAVDRSMRGRRLYDSALNVGRDHIGSLVNTMAFAYFGATLPLLLVLSLGFLPLSVVMNMEVIVAAALAVLVTSVGLVLSVPITTLVAMRLIGSRPPPAARTPLSE